MKTKEEIANVINAICGIQVEGTGCCPTAEHDRIATEAMRHLHAVTPEYIEQQWEGWADSCDSDRDIIANIAVTRACEIVVKKHRWDVNECFGSISYTPIIN